MKKFLLLNFIHLVCLLPNELLAQVTGDSGQDHCIRSIRSLVAIVEQSKQSGRPLNDQLILGITEDARIRQILKSEIQPHLSSMNQESFLSSSKYQDGVRVCTYVVGNGKYTPER